MLADGVHTVDGAPHTVAAFVGDAYRFLGDFGGSGSFGGYVIHGLGHLHDGRTGIFNLPGLNLAGFGQSVSDGTGFLHRGCDQSGNNCGLWTMSSSGGDRAPLTNVPDDNRPTWSPDGSFVVFMSSGRDGSYEIYRVESESGQVTRLTNNAAVDVLPVVSPDGAWVAYASNRDGSWKIWAVPSAGGAEHVVASLTGDISAWQEHSMQWVY